MIFFPSLPVTICGNLLSFGFLLSKENCVFGDTCDCAPLGVQFYSIHALICNNKIVPLIYSIVKYKNEDDYKE